MDSHPRGAGQAGDSPSQAPARGLYTEAERRRRDASRWTLVQGILAPLQFLVFLVSLLLTVPIALISMVFMFIHRVRMTTWC